MRGSALRWCVSPPDIFRLVPINYYGLCWLLLNVHDIRRHPQVRAYSFVRFLRYLLHEVCWSRTLWRCAHLSTSCSLCIPLLFVSTGLCSLASFSACLTTNHSRKKSGQALRLTNRLHQLACERLALSGISVSFDTCAHAGRKQNVCAMAGWSVSWKFLSSFNVWCRGTVQFFKIPQLYKHERCAE